MCTPLSTWWCPPLYYWEQPQVLCGAHNPRTWPLLPYVTPKLRTSSRRRPLTVLTVSFVGYYRPVRSGATWSQVWSSHLTITRPQCHKSGLTWHWVSWGVERGTVGWERSSLTTRWFTGCQGCHPDLDWLSWGYRLAVFSQQLSW